MRPFLVWGGGGHGKVVADLVRASGNVVAGFIDKDPGKLGLTVEPGGGKVVILESELLSGTRSSTPGEARSIALGIGDNRDRLERLGEIGGLHVPPLVHPSAVVSPSARLGPGSVVFAGAIINADARIGSAVIVNTAAVVEHDCWIGDGVHLAPGSILTGAVRVGTLSWVGAGATVLPGVQIGARVMVGAGAVVVQDVDDGMTVAGIPARPLRSKHGTANARES